MNNMTFNTQNKTEVVKFNELISFLISYNASNLDDYNEIHIYQEDALTIVEWEQVPHSGQYGGKFVYVDEEHAVLKDVRFPDGHCEYLHDDDAEEALNKWLEENPGWIRTAYGTWTNDFDNKEFREFLKDNTVIFANIDTDKEGKEKDE